LTSCSLCRVVTLFSSSYKFPCLLVTVAVNLMRSLLKSKLVPQLGSFSSPYRNLMWCTYQFFFYVTVIARKETGSLKGLAEIQCYVFISAVFVSYRYLLTYSLAYLLTNLITYLLTNLLIYLLTNLFSYLLTYLIIYLLTCLLTYLLTYLITY